MRFVKIIPTMILMAVLLSVTALAQSTDFSAFYAKTAPTMDGVSDIGVYVRSADFSDGTSDMGIGFDAEYVYVYVATGTEYSSFRMKIGDGTEIVYNISDGSFGGTVADSTGIVGENGIELKLSYSDLGIEFVPADVKRSISAKLVSDENEANISETAVSFRYTNIIMLDSCDDFTAAAYEAVEGQVKPENIYIGQNENGESSYTFKYLDTGVKSIKNITRNLYGYTVGDAAFEMNLTVNELPVITKEKLNGWRGFVFEVQNTVRRRFSLTSDAEGNILMNVLYHDNSDANGTTVTALSGKKLGDSFKLRGEYNDKNDLAVYIDDVLVHTFENIDYECPNSRWYFIISAAWYDVKSGSIDVEMHDFSFTTPIDALEDITAESILGTNADAKDIKSDLALCDSITVLGKSYDVVWSSSDTGIVTDDGKIIADAANSGKSVIMTATVLFGDVTRKREIQLTMSDELVPPVLSSYFTKNAVTVDGDASESVLLYNSEFDGIDAVLGTAWNTDGIALAVKHGTFAAADIKVSIGTKTLIYDIAGGAFETVTEGVSAVTADGVTEMFFAYSAIGLDFAPVERTLPFEVILSDGTDTYPASEKLLSTVCATLTSIDNCDDFASNAYKEYNKTGDHANLVRTDVNSGYSFVYGGESTFSYGFGKNTGGVLTAPYEIEMSVTATDLPVISTDDLRPWRGISLDLSDIIRARFSLTADDDGNIIFATLYGTGLGTAECLDTGKDLGDTFTWRISTDENYAVTLFIDGRKVGTLPSIDFTASYKHTYLEVNISNLDKISGGIDVRIQDIVIARHIPLMENLSFDDIKGSNVSADSVSTDLVLAKSVLFGDTNAEVPLTWTSSNPEYITNDGVLTYSEDSIGKNVTMTATAICGSVTLTKSFDITFGFELTDKDLYFLFGDKNPYTGALTKTSINFNFPFDANENSVGIDLGEVKDINTVTLFDSDDTNKMHRNDVSLYVSEDNVTYTRVKDFDLFRTEDKFIFAGFSVKARFVKVHCHISVSEFISFNNKLSDIISAEYNNDLVANGGSAFTKLGSIKLIAEKDISDGTAFVTFSEMGVPDADFKADKSDIRFAIGDRNLHHYIEDDGAYIRIPEAKANTSVTIDIYGKNENAESISDSGSVFEMVYGNRTISDLTDAENGFIHCISTARCPNGDLIAVGCKGAVGKLMTIRRSTDGGRTWGETKEFWNNNKHVDGCGFLVDGDKMYCFLHMFPIPSTSYYTLKVAILVSDDNGYTWKNPETGVVASPYFPAADKYYSVTYTDGIKLSTYDGEGEGIDYLFVYTISEDTSSDLKASIIYSKDGGKTWQSSESCITYKGSDSETELHESGVSEATAVELSDGRVKLYARVQYADNILLGESTSYDHGVTWEENCTLTEIYSSNTFPVLKKFDDDILLLWGGNNMQGGRSYFRAPINLAYSTDDMETWNAKHDILSGTSEGNVALGSYMCVQPKLVFNDYMGSDDIHFAWWKWRTNSNYAMLLEDAHDYIYKTKGAADSFESTSALYEGWSPIAGDISITDEKSTDGTHSMKIQDVTGKVVRASRSVPELYKGEISFDINLEKYSTYLYVELKSALSLDHYTGDKLAFCVDKNGNLMALDAANKTLGTSVAVLEKDKWYSLKVKFDLNDNMAKLYVDNTEVCDLPINTDIYGGICIVQLADGSSSQPAGLTAYVDNFRAYEGVSFTLAQDEPEEKTATVKVNLSRDNGAKPYSGEYTNFAKLYIYTDSTKSSLIKTIQLENADTSTSVITAELTLPEGTYYAEIIKNGYLTTKTELTVTSEGMNIGEVDLIPGDIKSDYTDECGDGIIDIDDFIRLLRGFYTDADAKLRAVVDINEDGSVNVTDLAYIKKNIGKRS